MKTVFNLHKFACTVCAVTVPLLLAACGENPLEAERDYHASLKGGYSESLSELKENLKDVDYYSCVQTYNETRCNNFKELFGSYDCKEIAETDQYDDNGDIIIPRDTTPEPEEDTTVINYLTKNKTLNIAITHYEQLVDFISEGDTLGDPEIKFTVKNYSDDEYVNTLTTYILLDTMDVIKWDGKKSSAIAVPRGMNKIEVCPIVSDLNKTDDILLSVGECLVIEDLGLVENRKVVAMKDTTSDKYMLEWEWFLY